MNSARVLLFCLLNLLLFAVVVAKALYVHGGGGLPFNRGGV